MTTHSPEFWGWLGDQMRLKDVKIGPLRFRVPPVWSNGIFGMKVFSGSNHCHVLLEI
jgi:hypothetical protein